VQQTTIDICSIIVCCVKSINLPEEFRRSPIATCSLGI